MRRWEGEDGKVGRWEDGKMGGWEDGRMGRWEDGKMGRWEDGRMGGWDKRGGGRSRTGIMMRFHVVGYVLVTCTYCTSTGLHICKYIMQVLCETSALLGKTQAYLQFTLHVLYILCTFYI